MKNQIKIGVIGLGYVGLPLARLFATKYPVVGFDINKSRISEIMMGNDSTLELDSEILKSALVSFNPTTQNEKERHLNGISKNRLVENQVSGFDINRSNTEDIYIENESAVAVKTKVSKSTFGILNSSTPNQNGLFCSSNIEDIRNCNFYVVTVPTPVDRNNRPDLTPLIKASETVGRVISKGDIVVYESTVYPGATEEDCIPVVEKTSGLKYNIDFFAGYSPERINPGDKEHTVEKIKKVTSGSTPEAAETIDSIYRSVIEAGTHLAPTIKVAEAAKVIENSQRDINIAFVNELAKIFNLMNIDTNAVLEAAGSKWNFLPFKPGLVGGHCIGVDPFYLAQKAQEYGYHPEIILAGRRLNDGMGKYVASEVVKLMIKKGSIVKGSKVLMLGITFKENCPDIRNTKAINIYHDLLDYGIEVDVYDPWADPKEVLHEYNINTLTTYPERNGYTAIILVVAHKEFLKINTREHKEHGCIIYDVKGLFHPDDVDGRL
jgi:UDP-N-acetyl-D-galactosamine dehydrogenase